jgi:CoA:oxalate CoA-transferase
MILGDMGAEVIKIERPQKGDEMRPWPPLINGLGSYFVMLNRNKKSITLNIRKSEGLNVLKRLLSTADVLVENSRPGVMERLGLAPESVLELNPKIVFCRISGFGQTGPYAPRPAFDQILQGMGGLMSVTGTKSSGPIRSGVAIGDILTSIFATNGILSALLAREKTKKGQVVSTSILESMVAILTVQAGIFLATGKTPPPAGNDHPIISPCGLFRVKDGYLNIAVGTDAMFENLCSEIDRPELATKAEYATNEKRMENRGPLKKEVEKALVNGTRREWEERLNAVRVPCGPVLTVDEVFSNPQVLHLDMLAEVTHPVLGLFRLPGLPFKLDATPGSIRTAPPQLGEHTEDIMEELGYTREDVQNFYAEALL